MKHNPVESEAKADGYSEGSGAGAAVGELIGVSDPRDNAVHPDSPSAACHLLAVG